MHTSGSVRPLIREDIPSSGQAPHTHDWQVLREDAQQMTLVCRKDGCSATKTVPKPAAPKNESADKRPVLLG